MRTTQPRRELSRRADETPLRCSNVGSGTEPASGPIVVAGGSVQTRSTLMKATADDRAYARECMQSAAEAPMRMALFLLFLTLVAPAQAETRRGYSVCSVDPLGLLFSCTFRETYEDQPRGLSPEEAQDRSQEDRAWRAYCRPRIEQDKFGVRRYVYAKPGCEFGRTSPPTKSHKDDVAEQW
jgi:hypothetical protein